MGASKSQESQLKIHTTLSETTEDQLMVIDARTPLMRGLLILAVVLALLGGWKAAHWYVGNAIADFAPDADEGGLETTRYALSIAPGDPLVYWSAANFEKGTLDPTRMPEAVRLYEEAVRRSPNDYRFWQDLGLVREQAGDGPGGEKAMRRAINLAPSYSRPRWYLGNLLLRAGRTEEAFTELRRAADTNPSVMRMQVFSAAWRIFDRDVPAIERIVGSSAETRAQLAAYLAANDRAEDAVRLWTGLNGAEKNEQRKTGEALMKALFERKKYRAAQALARDLGLESAEGPGQFANGGFENGISIPGTSLFGWQISNIPQTEVALDASQSRTGNRSLRIVFNGFPKAAYYNIGQIVVVDPSTRYKFEGFVRTQDLKSGGTPVIEVANAMDGIVLGTSAPFPMGRNDWQPVTIEFSTPEKIEGIHVRTNRAFCGDVCPIFGIIWYDDFNLQNLGPATGSGKNERPGSKDNSGNPAAR